MERQGYDLLCDAKELVCIDMYVFAMEEWCRVKNWDARQGKDRVVN